MDKKKLKEVRASVEKEFGKGSLILMGDEDDASDIEVIPTGIFSLDRALGIGGIPKGRMIEVFGPESTGKTSLALYMVAAAQQRGDVVAFIDAEHSLDLKMARRLGVNTDDLLLSQPDNGEQALEIIDHLVRTGDVGIIVVDSVAALTPKAEIDGEMGDSHMGLQARLMSQCCRKVTGLASKAKTTIVWINQTRMKIGVFFGNPETTTGGTALKFYATLRLEVRKGAKITDKDSSVVGHTMRVKVVKNKLASPFKDTELPLIYGRGVDVIGDLFDLAVKNKVVDKAGAWYSFDGDRLGQGRAQALDKIVAKDLTDKIKEKLNEVSEKETS
jgi:recombination protein RecA